MTPTDIADTKIAMRSQAKARRRLAAPGAAAAAARLAGAAEAVAALAAPGAVVAGTWPLGDEIDGRTLLERLAALGHSLALPVVVAPDQALVFRRWTPGEALEQGPFATRHPAATAPAVVPGLVLVPLLAFDGEGFRLGYGGGYYDRTLALLRGAGRVTALGLAYASQRVPSVPHDGHDQRLDGVVTEEGLMRI
jgi:5-formyltetrahydrofolate cyclo-ligase